MMETVLLINCEYSKVWKVRISIYFYTQTIKIKVFFLIQSGAYIAYLNQNLESSKGTNKMEVTE